MACRFGLLGFPGRQSGHKITPATPEIREVMPKSMVGLEHAVIVWYAVMHGEGQGKGQEEGEDSDWQ